jgi:hypothetical protein
MEGVRGWRRDRVRERQGTVLHVLGCAFWVRCGNAVHCCLIV